MMQPVSLCSRREVRCELLDADGKVLVDEENGPVGRKCGDHCLAFAAPGLDHCEGIHAEQLAVVHALEWGVLDRCRTARLTLSPCRACMKLLALTPIRLILYEELWTDPTTAQFWASLGREMRAL